MKKAPELSVIYAFVRALQQSPLIVWLVAISRRVTVVTKGGRIEHYGRLRVPKRVWKGVGGTLLLCLVLVVYTFLASSGASTSQAIVPRPNQARLMGTKTGLFQDTMVGHVNSDTWKCRQYVGMYVDDMRIKRDWPNNPTTRGNSTEFRVAHHDIDNLAVKMYGYLMVPMSGQYQFRLVAKETTSVFNGEVWLSTNTLPKNLRKVLTLEGSRKFFSKSSRATSGEIWLNDNSSYYIEFHIKAFGGQLDVLLQWKVDQFGTFMPIPRYCLAMAVKLSGNSYDTSASSSSLIRSLKDRELPSNKLQSHGYKHYVTDKSYTVTNIPAVLPRCHYTSNDSKVQKVEQYKGIFKVTESAVYPPDEIPKGHRKGNKNISEQVVNIILILYKKALSSTDGYRDADVDVRYMEETRNGKNGSRYLLELDIQNDGVVTHTSEYVYLPKNSFHLCHTYNFQWKQVVDVYLVVSVKNLNPWICHLIHNMEYLYEQTHDNRFELVVVDFESSDGDISTLLMQSSLPRWKLINLYGPFSRAAGLQAGIDYVGDPNSIVMTIDLHLTLPPGFIQGIRKHVIQGKMAYAPMFYKLNPGYTEINDEIGYWEVLTYGLFGLFKSDWRIVGGFDTVGYTYNWGQEDWNILDRTLSKGYEVFRIRPVGLYHYFHTRTGMWGNPAKHNSNSC